MILFSVLERPLAALPVLLRFSAACSRLDQLCPTITVTGLLLLTRTTSTAVPPPAMSASWPATPTGSLTVMAACLLLILWPTGCLSQYTCHVRPARDIRSAKRLVADKLP